MKKIRNISIGITLLLLSFYYTNIMTISMKENSPIMQEIKKTEEKYYIEPLDAIIEENTIRSGKRGEEVDYKKTYKNMVNYGTYNESLTVMKEVEPTVSINDNYDKYIIGGNKNNRNISLVFKLKDNVNPEKIISILKDKKIDATFFIDGTYIEKNLSIIRNLTTYELEVLSYNNAFHESYIKASMSYLETISKTKVKYCYAEKEDEKILNICSKLKMHTIKPTLTVKNNLYKEVKSNLDNSIIISLEVNNYIEKELPIVIDYIKSKGYNLTTLHDLIKEE